LESAHEIVVVFGRINCVQADRVDTKVLQIGNVLSPSVCEFVCVKIDRIGFAERAIVRAWIIRDTLDRKIFVGGGIIKSFPLDYERRSFGPWAVKCKNCP